MRVTRQIALAVSALWTVLLVACGGGRDPPASKPPAATIMSIAVSPGTVSVAKGLTQQFKATGTHSGGSTADMWTATGSLNIARSSHTATLLASDKVLVAGGVDASGKMTASAEGYDPTTNTWSLTASLPTPLTGDAATLLANGQVLVAGGQTFSVEGVSSAELYSP